MKKYYLIAIKKGNINAMNDLGEYYYSRENNYDLMKKYYLMFCKYKTLNNIINHYNIRQIYYRYKFYGYKLL
jgi:hypothetical protein